MSVRIGAARCRDRRGLLAVVVLAGLVSAACGSSTTATAPPSTTTPTATAPVQQSVPLEVSQAPGDVTCAVTDVVVAGGRPVRVLVDTGSTQLVVPADAIGPAAQPTGRRTTTQYVNSPAIPVEVVRAQVGIGPAAAPQLTTPAPVAVEAAATPPQHLCGSSEGVLGVGAGNTGAGTAPEVQSPLTQLAAPLSTGFTIDLTGSTGVLTAGAPVTTPRTVTLPLPREDGTYPDGRPAHGRDPVLCWTVGGQHGCGPTNVDSGFGFPAIRPDLLPGAGYPALAPGRTGPVLPAGTAVTIGSPGGATLESFTSQPTPRADQLRLTGLFGDTRANTGIGLFQHALVGVDFSTGQMIITPR